MEKDHLDFDHLMELHDEIKVLKRNIAKDILKNFLITEGKFGYKGKKRKESASERLNLSSNAACLFALSKYIKFWNENNIEYKKDFGNLETYYEYIAGSLILFCKSSIPGLAKHLEEHQLQAPDEFTILNVLSLLKRFKMHSNSYDSEVIGIIKLLCDLYKRNKLAYSDNTHPFIYMLF